VRRPLIPTNAATSVLLADPAATFPEGLIEQLAACGCVIEWVTEAPEFAERLRARIGLDARPRLRSNGVYDREIIEDLLHRACSRARRFALSLAVMAVAVDSIDDPTVTPPEAREVVLAAVASRLARRLRREDLLGWWGSGIWLVVAGDTGHEGARTLAHDLRDAVRGAPIAVPAGPLYTTASVGWSSSQGESAEATVTRAQSALDRARAAGGGHVAGPAADA